MTKMTPPQDMKLSDFTADNIENKKAEATEDQKIMDLLGRFTASMLMDGLRHGHPEAEWGEGETWRHYYINECRRRGIRLLLQLDWPFHKKALYVNIHTGSIRTLDEIASHDGYFSRNTISDDVWSIVEHWEPYDESKPNLYKIKYLEREIEQINNIKLKTKKDTYDKSLIKDLLGYEEQIRQEKAKAFSEVN
jgi:hypothetical protein